MLVVPTSKIILLKNPIEIDYLNELTFSSKTAQYNYFHSLPKLECDNATYQRKDEVVRFPTDPDMEGVTYDDLVQYNYCMYQNDKWSNKWFYAFVKEVIFDNLGMSYIKLETDVWQSWCFDITFKSSFIEREHVNDDTIGKHTIPENLELGETIQNSDPTEIFSRGYMTYICIACTEVANNTPHVSDARSFNGIYSGLYYLLFDNSSDASKYIHAMDSLGKADSINSVFLIPVDFQFSSTWYNATIGDYSFKFAVLNESNLATVLADNQTITLPSTLDSYTPKNNKLFTYPFNFFYVSNHVGSDVVYRYEDFTNNSPSFRVIGAITPGCSIKCIPLNYKKTTDTSSTLKSYNYGINCGKYPVCSWNSDVYTNWLTQNGVNIALDLLTSGVKIVGGAISENYGLAAQGSLSIANTIAQVYQHSLIPDQARGNTNSGDVTFSSQYLIFTAYKMCIREEYCKIIDNYFSAYGYKVNTYKIPNITGRTYWNYVKTIGCNLIGDIPQQDLEKIKDIFNNGVTMWHDPSKFLDYSQNNTIVT